MLYYVLILFNNSFNCFTVGIIATLYIASLFLECSKTNLHNFASYHVIVGYGGCFSAFFAKDVF